MLFDLFQRKTSQAQPEKKILEDIVLSVQMGDNALRNQLLEEYKPYMARVTSKVCKRYIDPTKDDEFSVALLAFNEALDSYDVKHNASFLTFAEVVIRRRMIDYIRKESRYQKQIPMTSFEVEDEEEHTLNPIENQKAIANYVDDQVKVDRKSEIITFTKEISKYGITLEDLVKESPKHKDSRQNMLEIVDVLLKHPEMVQELLEKKTLPIKKLLPKVEFSRKTIERNRKYIIAIVIIQLKEFYFLKDYIRIDS